MRTIAVANQKGGCGKTTTAINLSSCLAQKGQRVLLVDVDPQSHATLGLGIDSDPEKSVYHVLSPSQTDAPGLEDIIVPVKENLDVAPSDTKLSILEQELAGVEGRENRLMKAIEPINGKYDYILIDCPPSIGHLCFNALRASTEVIIPIDMSLFSLRGIAKLTDMIVLIKDTCDHVVEPRALVTMYDYRTRYSRQVLEKVQEKFEDKVFTAVIRYNIRLRETVDHGLPIGDYDKHAIGQKDYDDLAGEVLSSHSRETSSDSHASNRAQEILETTEDYIESVETTPMTPDESHQYEEDYPYPAQSSYSAMVEAIAKDYSEE
jgi:chromosome partitioning protein